MRNLFLGLLALTLSLSSQASIQLHATRVVFLEEKPDTTISFTNRDLKKPYLVRSWLEKDGWIEKDGNPKIPVVVTPPLVRIDAQKEGQLRFFYAGSGLPSETESLLWLNVQEVPPVSDQPNTLQIAIRTRIKFFFRPRNLRSTVEEAYAKLTSKIVTRPDGRTVLEIRNASPYHISLSEVYLKPAEGEAKKLKADMVLPNSSLEVPLDKNLPHKNFVEVRYEIINDYGGITEKSHALAR